MQILWSIGKGFVHDILDRFPEPRPAYNTVSTILRILEKKGYVDHDSLGKSHMYFPRVERSIYMRSYLRNFVHRYFSDSYQSLTSFFLREDELSLEELELMRRHIDDHIGKKQRP